MKSTTNTNKSGTSKNGNSRKLQQNSKKFLALGPAVAISAVAIERGWGFWSTLLITVAITLLTLFYERHTSKKNAN